MTKTITETTQENDSVELKLDTKGNYSWSIKVYGNNLDDMIQKISDTDHQLKTKYANEKQ